MTHRNFSDSLGQRFVVNVEVVPPACGEATLADKFAEALLGCVLDAVNVADSPMACPRMAPIAFSCLLRQRLREQCDVIPHLAARDRSLIAAQGLLWGMRALGIGSVLIVRGDPVAGQGEFGGPLFKQAEVTQLVRLAVEAGLCPGVVLDPRPAHLVSALRKLEDKVNAGARFVITQPLYEESAVDALARATEGLGVPVLLGILPLAGLRHARFLDKYVPEITVPEAVLCELQQAGDDARSTGLRLAREMLTAARHRLAGACIMPPFENFDLVAQIVSSTDQV